MITELDRELEITGDSGSSDVVVRPKITSLSVRKRSRVNETWIKVSSATTLDIVSILNSLWVQDTQWELSTTSADTKAALRLFNQFLKKSCQYRTRKKNYTNKGQTGGSLV